VSSKPKKYKRYETVALFLTLYHTRLRAGELAALLLSDITIGERSDHVTVRRGKGNKARRVPLNAEARAVIHDYLQVHPSCERQNFLIGQRSEPLSAHAIYDVVVKYGRRAGLDEMTPIGINLRKAHQLLWGRE